MERRWSSRSADDTDGRLNVSIAHGETVRASSLNFAVRSPLGLAVFLVPPASSLTALFLFNIIDLYLNN
jgi:hypothetical protein